MSFRYSDEELKNNFPDGVPKVEIEYHKYDHRSIRYLSLISNPKLPYVVFIHGAPGSLADYLQYFKDESLYSKLNLISVDRIGYGNSEFGESESSLQIQAESIQSIIAKECHSDKVILIGHSYGGPIAVKMAMEYQNSYKGIILLAPALDPDNEKEIWLSQLPKFQPIRWLSPPALKVAADEKNSHIKELRKILGGYQDIEIPICHIHGTSDSLVPYENLNFSKVHFNAEYLEPISLENADHFLPWSHYDLVAEKILEIAIK